MKLTGLKRSRRAAVLAQLQEWGYKHDNLQGATIDAYLEELKGIEKGGAILKTDTQDLIDALEMYRALSFSATKKLKAMLARTSEGRTLAWRVQVLWCSAHGSLELTRGQRAEPAPPDYQRHRRGLRRHLQRRHS